MNNKEIESVLSLNKDKLYKTFLLRVADYNKVWVLDDDGIQLYGDCDGNQIFPIWPEKEFAELCAIGYWKGSSAMPIELNEFLEEYVPDLIESNISLAIFPRTNNEESIILEARQFTQVITEYISEEYGENIELSYLTEI